MAKSNDQTFFFYDLETSGLNPRDDRIMQFAGQRTDMNLMPIGDPFNLLIALNDDTLPSPDALMVTGITPQKTVDEGYTEAEFAKIFTAEISTPDTIMVGYNNIRFDDEFMRALLWRSYYDPYEWSYLDGRSKWDLLDVVRMTRALRPEGINWPIVDGKPTNRLELLASGNGVKHENAHDALSDVNALIDVAKLLRSHQPQLFDYLLKIRTKDEIKKIVDLTKKQPFVYSSGRYDAEFEKTTVAIPIAEADHGNVFVYDLRYDPKVWIDKTEAELREIIYTPYKDRGEDYVAVPVKKLQFNRCPAIAPLGVLEQHDGWQKLSLDIGEVELHRKFLLENPELTRRISTILLESADYPKSPDAEGKLYDGFIDQKDKIRLQAIQNFDSKQLSDFEPMFDDKRLADMYPRYKAYNFRRLLSETELLNYQSYRTKRLSRQLPSFTHAMKRLSSTPKLSSHQNFVLEELQLWFESIMPDEPESQQNDDAEDFDA